MVRGYYVAGSGLVSQQKKLNVYADNIANVSTAGFKKDNLVSGTFGEHMAVRMNKYQGKQTVDIGPGVHMQTIVDEYTDHSQGGFIDTMRPMDMAIQGDGYFIIADDEGNEYLTRDGQFSLDEDGFLVLPGYGRVQGDGGDIEIGTSDFLVNRAGEIYLMPAEEDEEPELIARVSIAVPDDVAAMKKAQNGLFVTEDYEILGEELTATQILQNKVERSNVGLAEEMTRMMDAQRTFQSCSQILKMYDELSDQMNTRVARV